MSDIDPAAPTPERYAKGGWISGPGIAIPFMAKAGEEVIRSNGEVLRFEPCDGGLVLKPTGKRYDVLAALRALNEAQPTVR